MKHIVKEAFYAEGRVYAAGHVLDGDDPIVAGREHLFTAVGEPEPESKPEPPKRPERPQRPAQGKSKE